MDYQQPYIPMNNQSGYSNNQSNFGNDSQNVSRSGYESKENESKGFESINGPEIKNNIPTYEQPKINENPQMRPLTGVSSIKPIGNDSSIDESQQLFDNSKQNIEQPLIPTQNSINSSQIGQTMPPSQNAYNSYSDDGQRGYNSTVPQPKSKNEPKKSEKYKPTNKDNLEPIPEENKDNSSVKSHGDKHSNKNNETKKEISNMKKTEEKINPLLNKTDEKDKKEINENKFQNKKDEKNYKILEDKKDNVSHRSKEDKKENVPQKNKENKKDNVSDKAKENKKEKSSHKSKDDKKDEKKNKESNSVKDNSLLEKKSIHSQISVELQKRRKLVAYNDSNQEKASRIFIKKLEKNMNNSLNLEPTVNNNRESNGYVLKLYPAEGLKLPTDKFEGGNYFVRFFVNLYDDNLKEYIGNIYKSPMFPAEIDATNRVIMKFKGPTCSFFLCNEKSNYYLLIQAIFVIKNDEDIILNQICLGWTHLNPLLDKTTIDVTLKASQNNKIKQKDMYEGTPRVLIYKSFLGLKGMADCRFFYEFLDYPQMVKIKPFIPDFINIGGDEILPGLLSGAFPQNPIGDPDEIECVNSEELIISNVKIEIDSNLEDDIIKFAGNYFKKKYGDKDEIAVKKIYIKERRLKCGLHNTWCFINSNGLENSISLINKDTILRCRGKLNIDRFFVDDTSSVALILELSYIVQIPIVPDKEYEVINLPIGYSIFIPTRENIKNEKQSAFIITGPGTTVYGEHLWVPPRITERTISIEFNLQRTNVSLNASKMDEALSQSNANLDDSKLIKITELENDLKKQSQNLNYYKNQSLLKENENLKLKYQIAMLTNQKTGYVPGQSTDKLSDVKSTNKNADQQLNLSQINSELKSQNLSENELKITQEFIKTIQALQGKITQPKDEKKEDEQILYDRFQSDIPRNDEARLLEERMLTLKIEDFSNSTLDYYFKQEFLGQLGHKFRFEFLSYKPPKGEIPAVENLPQRLRFEFSFWTIQNKVSPVGKVLKPEEYLQYYNNPLLIVPDNSNLNVDDNYKKIYIEFEYDPSIEKGIDYKMFISFLLTRQLPIKVFDVNKHMNLGVIKVPLKDLLRCGKPQMVSNKEYEIFDNQLEIKGYIQMSIFNFEMELKNKYLYDENDLKLISSDDALLRLKQKKKVKVKPITQSKISEGKEAELNTLLNRYADKTSEYTKKGVTRNFRLDIESEKKLRVMKYFNIKENKEADYKIHLEEEKLRILRSKKEQDEEYYKNLNYVNIKRDMDKNYILSKVDRESHKNTFEISLIQGNPHFFNYVVKNESDIDEIYHIVISKDKNIEKEKIVDINDNTVSILTIPSDWEIAVKNKKLIPPNDYNMIDYSGNFKIHAGESVPLAIKLLSFEQSQSEKSYTIWIHKKTGEPLHFLIITIKKVFPVFDHIFTYNMPCSQENTINVLNPFKFDKEKTLLILSNIVMSDYKISVTENIDTSDFQYKYTTKEQGTSSYLIMYFYRDDLRINLYMTWKIEINSVNYIEKSCCLGERTTDNWLIENKNDELQTLQLFSENNSIVSLIKNYSDLPFTLKKREKKDFLYVTYPKRKIDTMCLLNCVNCHTGQLNSSLLIKFKLDKPKIDESIKVICRAKNNTNITFLFENKMNVESVFYFYCEESKYLVIADPKLHFNPLDKKKVALIIPPQRYLSKKEVLFFAYSENFQYTRTINFMLFYK